MKTLWQRSMLILVFMLGSFSLAWASQKISGVVVLRQAACASVGVSDAKLTIYSYNGDGSTSLATDIYRNAALTQHVDQQGLDFIRSNVFFAWEFYVPDGVRRYDIVFSEGTITNKFSLTYQVPFPDGYINVKAPPYNAKGNGVDDDTEAIQKAVNDLGIVGGGTLYFPNGFYKVGNPTLSRYNLPIKIPSGVTIQGANGGTASTSLGSCRLQLSDSAVGKTVFQIGECQDRMNIKDIVIYANSSLPNWTQTVGVEAKGAAPNSTYHTDFKNVTFYGLGRGISVVADLVNDPVQGWQFDSVKVDHCVFAICDVGIYTHVYNTDWHISSTWFFLPAKVTGVTSNGMQIEKGGAYLIENSFGGGGGNWLEALVSSNITIENSQCEGTTNSLVFKTVTGFEGDYSYPISILNSIFGDPIRIQGRRTFTSHGSLYGPTTFSTLGSGVRVYSFGDRFCYDGNNPVLNQNDPSQVCAEERETDFGGAKVIFRTGQPADGRAKAGAARVGTDFEIKNDEEPTKPVLTVMAPNDYTKPLVRLGQSSFFYEVRRDASGFLSFTGSQDPPYKGYRFDAPVQLPTFAHASLPSGTVTGGAMVYCSNCLRNSAPCVVGGSGGAPATIINGVWECK